MSEQLTNAIFCLTGLSAGTIFGFIVRALLTNANQRLRNREHE